MTQKDILRFLRSQKQTLHEEGIKRIGLFGSFAKDKADSNSDIDVAVELEDDYLQKHDVWDYFDTLERIKLMLAKKFHRKSDIYDLQSTSRLNTKISDEVIYV
ncbi:MAG: nucleotidyltransferase family protein [Campylobacterota bacterium]